MHAPFVKSVPVLLAAVLLASCDDAASPVADCTGSSVFIATGGPTLRVSTQAIIPTVLMSAIDHTSTTSGGVTTASIIAGPNGTTNNGVFTLANPPAAGATLVGAIATLPGTILVAGTPLALSATSLAGSVGLTWSDFGVWSIGDQLAAPLPTNAVVTYSAFAGGTQLTTAMPASGTATYTGAMTGVLAYTVIGGSDDVGGSTSLNVDFGAGTISGTISGITTAAGATTVSPYATYAPLQTPPLSVPFSDITVSGGIISGNSFTATATSPTIGGATIMTIAGKFYGPSANELAGTFTISEATPGAAHILIGSIGAKP